MNYCFINFENDACSCFMPLSLRREIYTGFNFPRYLTFCLRSWFIPSPSLGSCVKLYSSSVHFWSFTYCFFYRQGRLILLSRLRSLHHRPADTASANITSWNPFIPDISQQVRLLLSHKVTGIKNAHMKHIDRISLIISPFSHPCFTSHLVVRCLADRGHGGERW